MHAWLASTVLPTPSHHKVSLSQRVETYRSGTYGLIDATSEGRIIQGTHHPKDALSKERNIRDFISGTHCRWWIYIAPVIVYPCSLILIDLVSAGITIAFKFRKVLNFLQWFLNGQVLLELGLFRQAEAGTPSNSFFLLADSVLWKSAHVMSNPKS